MIRDEIQLARERLSGTVPPWKPRVPGWMLTRVIIRATIEGTVPAVISAIVFNHNGGIPVSLGFVGSLALIVWLLSFVRVRKLQRLVREAAIEYYRRQRPPFCLHCGYDLREITSAKCPECGIPLPSASQIPSADNP